ncbi:MULTISPECIES: helix-turn-helix transcriptional regulator [Brevibacterium]|uniref:YafY family transcriptional regulator n=1 Tax=Brevibacterium casei TaxID=33889 RepID=A0A7T4A124_9MICO|nr:YafY family protein [Brevibacterium casei]QQB15346.1 YafY family transcriptional regulator [Brevibacterium casei]
MRTEVRLLRMLALLSSGRGLTAAELAAEFGVTTRTVRRDITALRELGYAIDAAPGVAGGYRAHSRTLLPPLQLAAGEAMATGLGLALLRGAGLSTATAESAGRKLTTMLPPTMAATVRAVETAVTVAPGHAPDVDHETVVTIASAISSRRRVTFAYAKPWTDAEAEQRRVEPAQLVVLGAHWYLFGWDLDREDWRVFRLDRMSAVRATTFPIPARTVPDAEAAVRRAVTAAAYEHTVILDVDAVKSEAEAWFPTRAATITEVPGGVRIEFGVTDLRWAAALTGSIPAACRVIAPGELIAELRALRTRVDAICNAEVSGK